MGNPCEYILSLIFCLTLFATNVMGQFKENAFTQTYNEKADSTAVADTADKLFSFKEYFGGLAHKNTIQIGTMFAGSVILPGTAQIYNKDYWKLPIVYGGIGAFAASGGYYLHKYKTSVKAFNTYKAGIDSFDPNVDFGPAGVVPAIDYKAKTMGTWLMVSAGLFYWGSLMDGVVSYKSDKSPLPGRATLYSALLPGLGQIYNGELFKVPIYWGGLLISGYFLYTNNNNYVRFKRIHNEATSSPNYSEGISAETAKWYRDVYRRYRDYSIVATALVYLLQVIDANVFSYMHDFEVNDDISMEIQPTIISPDNAYAFNPGRGGYSQNAVGMRIGFRF